MKACLFTIAMLIAGARVVHAAEADGAPDAARSTDDVLDADYSTFLHGPLSGRRASMLVDGGWDAAAGRARLDVRGWVPLFGRVSVVMGAHHGADREWRPEAGLALALGDGGRSGLQGNLLLQYRAEGFTEPEGELELTLRGGLRGGAGSIVGEISYGQDPEASEQDAEAGLDASMVRGAFSLGLGGRWRVGLGDVQEAVRWDVSVGPHVGLVVDEGHFVGLSGGLSLLSLDGETRAGIVGVASYAVAY